MHCGSCRVQRISIFLLIRTPYVENRRIIRFDAILRFSVFCISLHMYLYSIYLSIYPYLPTYIHTYIYVYPSKYLSFLFVSSTTSRDNVISVVDGSLPSAAFFPSLPYSSLPQTRFLQTYFDPRLTLSYTCYYRKQTK